MNLKLLTESMIYNHCQISRPLVVVFSCLKASKHNFLVAYLRSRAWLCACHFDQILHVTYCLCVNQPPNTALDLTRTYIICIAGMTLYDDKQCFMLPKRMKNTCVLPWCQSAMLIVTRSWHLCISIMGTKFSNFFDGYLTFYYLFTDIVSSFKWSLTA